MEPTAAPHRPDRSAPGAAGWTPASTVVAAVVALALALAGRMALGDGREPRLAPTMLVIVLTLVPIGVIVVLARGHGIVSAPDFGLRRPPLLRATVLIAVIGLTLFAVTALLVALVGFGDEAPNYTLARAAVHGTPNALLVIVLVAVASPLGEEFLFRGFLYRALVNWRGPLLAAFISTGVFAAFHIGWVPPAVLGLSVVFGLGMCLLYHRTGSLYPALGFHALLNASSIGTVPAWDWPLPLTMAAAVVATLAIARLIAQLLGFPENDHEVDVAEPTPSARGRSS
jgi:membrane protease YdiL (CAAX protease family)